MIVMTLSKAVKVLLAFLFLGFVTYVIWHINKAVYMTVTEALSE